MYMVQSGRVEVEVEVKQTVFWATALMVYLHLACVLPSVRRKPGNSIIIIIIRSARCW